MEIRPDSDHVTHSEPRQNLRQSSLTLWALQRLPKLEKSKNADFHATLSDAKSGNTTFPLNSLPEAANLKGRVQRANS